MRGVFLHVLADALGSVIVCASACVYMFTDFAYKEYVDPTLSVLMVILIMYSTWGLLVESAMILLQTVPTHIQVDSLQKKLLQEVSLTCSIYPFCHHLFTTGLVIVFLKKKCFYLPFLFLCSNKDFFLLFLLLSPNFTTNFTTFSAKVIAFPLQSSSLADPFRVFCLLFHLFLEVRLFQEVI